ncbi:hypothetical protein CRE_01245 [Caenorhabditis remanei]|uniref:Uncharacterized protein n=1 Tax=Caenorhabditis remanei TaxID=31234 RepID=E3N4S3_CAERE|nr:hypothetical protein CRE_01245 [Caenorhabditis remanei]
MFIYLRIRRRPPKEPRIQMTCRFQWISIWFVRRIRKRRKVVKGRQRAEEFFRETRQKGLISSPAIAKFRINYLSSSKCIYS